MTEARSGKPTFGETDMRTRFIVAGLACALAVLLGMLGYGAEAADKRPQTLRALSDLAPAPGFTLADLDGNTHQLADYRGRVVIVNFWATWCPPCREEMPSMQRAWEQIQSEGIVILAINVGETEDRVFTFTADYPLGACAVAPDGRTIVAGDDSGRVHFLELID